MYIINVINGGKMYKIPFYISGLISNLFPGQERRRCVRGNINVFLFRGAIVRFIRRVYGVRVKSVRFVRQVSMNRMTCVVNNRYYVKIFRDVSVARLNDYKFLLDFVRLHIDVEIPTIFVANKIPMYVADKLPGENIHAYDKTAVIRHEKKIKSAVVKMIDDLQSIPVKSIPNKERYLMPLQYKSNKQKPTIQKNSVLAHLDLNISNLMLDKNYNVVGVVDWDSLSIVNDPNLDRDGFERMWNIYKTKPVKNSSRL